MGKSRKYMHPTPCPLPELREGKMRGLSGIIGYRVLPKKQIFRNEKVKKLGLRCDQLARIDDFESAAGNVF
jgi:hypothetical protein